MSKITDTERKRWLLINRPEINFDGLLYTMTTWVCAGDAGNKHGCGGLFFTRGQSLDNCIDWFIEGDIEEAD